MMNCSKIEEMAIEGGCNHAVRIITTYSTKKISDVPLFGQDLVRYLRLDTEYEPDSAVSVYTNPNK